MYVQICTAMINWGEFDLLLKERDIEKINHFIYSENDIRVKIIYKYMIYRLATDEIQKMAIIENMKIYELINFNDLEILKKKKTYNNEDIMFSIQCVVEKKYNIELFKFLIEKYKTDEIDNDEIMICIINCGTLEQFNLFFQKINKLKWIYLYDASGFNSEIFFRLIELGVEIGDKSELIKNAKRCQNYVLLDYLTKFT